jgi:subfamily B ATP-binding cassette protein MsbA
LKETFRRYKPYFKDYKLQFFFVVIGILLTVSATAGLAHVMQPMMDEMFIKRDAEMLTLIPLAVVTIYVAKSVGRYIQTIGMGYIGQHIIARLRERLLEKIIRMDMNFLYVNRSGELISRVTNDIERVKYFVSNMLPELVREFLTVITLIGYMIYLNPKLAMYALVVLPLIVYPLMLIAKRLKRYAHRVQEKNADIVSRLTEVFNNSEVIKANATERFEMERFSFQNWKLFKVIMKALYVSDLVPPMLEVIASIGIASVIFIGGREVIDGNMTVGEFTAFLTAVGLMLDPARRLGAIYSKIQDAIAATERIFAIIDQKTDIHDGDIKLEKDIVSIELKNVKLSYGDKTALENINLSVNEGQNIALVGDSGGGKSSLINLLLRFYDANEGEVLINGTSIREFTQDSLRHHISVVSQRVYIFQDTLAANVAYGQEIDEERVMEALHLSDASEFVASLPEGIHTMMEEFGANLSGGQRQRIAIARTIYKHASLLLLDEATSALDNESEKRIQKALEDYTKDKLTITIAHRLSTIEHADCIYVFREGRIVGSGTHKELLEHSEEYQKLAGKLA